MYLDFSVDWTRLDPIDSYVSIHGPKLVELFGMDQQCPWRCHWILKFQKTHTVPSVSYFSYVSVYTILILLFWRTLMQIPQASRWPEETLTQTGDQGTLYSEDLSLLKKEMGQELWNSLLSCLKNKILKQTNSYLLYSQTCRLLRENEEHSEYPRVDKVQLWMCLRRNIKDFFNYKDFLTVY